MYCVIHQWRGEQGRSLIDQSNDMFLTDSSIMFAFTILCFLTVVHGLPVADISISAIVMFDQTAFRCTCPEIARSDFRDCSSVVISAECQLLARYCICQKEPVHYINIQKRGNCMGRASHVIEEPSDVEIDLTSELEELRDAKSTPDEFVSEPGKWKGPKGTYVLENAMDNDLHNHVHVVTKLNDDGTKTGRYLIKKVRMSLMNDEGNILESLGELVDECNGHIVIKYHEGVELHSYLFDLFDHWNADKAWGETLVFDARSSDWLDRKPARAATKTLYRESSLFDAEGREESCITGFVPVDRAS